MTAWEQAGLGVTEFEALPLGARIAVAALPYQGWGYGGPRVAYESGSVPSTLVGGERKTNCSTLTVSVLMAVYNRVDWTLREYGELQVFGDELRAHPEGDSPIHAVTRHGVGRQVPDFEDGWHLVQGWRRLDPDRPSGHAFLVMSTGSRACAVLESTSLDRDGGGDGPSWRATTHAALRDMYPAALHIAHLYS